MREYAMAYSDEQHKSFERAARPMIKWLADNASPHSYVILTNLRAELLSGEMAMRDESFLQDDET
jgi:hypothetical protein